MAIKIFIDQGHNPSNPNAGAEGNGLREQDIVYEIGVAAATLLGENPNFEVRLSRPSPDTVLGTTNAESLRARVEAANDWGADAFISLHVNSSSLPSASGVEGFAYSVPSPAASLGEAILRGVSLASGFPDRGMSRRTGLYVLRKTAMPAVLIELGFITNRSEAALLSAEPYTFARGIYDGIVEYYSASGVG